MSPERVFARWFETWGRIAASYDVPTEEREWLTRQAAPLVLQLIEDWASIGDTERSHIATKIGPNIIHMKSGKNDGSYWLKEGLYQFASLTRDARLRRII